MVFFASRHIWTGFTIFRVRPLKNAFSLQPFMEDKNISPPICNIFRFVIFNENDVSVTYTNSLKEVLRSILDSFKVFQGSVEQEDYVTLGVAKVVI